MRRSRATYVLAALYLLVLFNLARQVTYLPRFVSFTPDDAVLALTYREDSPVRAREHPPADGEEITLEQMQRVIESYGAALNELAQHPDSVVDASRLPYPKETIKKTILAALEVMKEAEHQRNLKAAFVGLASFQDGVGTEPVTLDEEWERLVGREEGLLRTESREAGLVQPRLESQQVLSLRSGNHLLGPVQYYLLSRVVDLTIPLLKTAASVFFLLTVLYAAWVSYRYQLFPGYASLALCAVLLANQGPFLFYSQLATFDYSQRILISVLLLDVLLFLHRSAGEISKPALLSLSILLATLTVAYAALLVPILVLAATSWLSTHWASEAPSSSRLDKLTRNSIVLAAPSLFCGLITLRFFTHIEFLQPREEIRALFFPSSGYSKDVAGVTLFVFRGTIDLLASTFQTSLPLGPPGRAASALLFIAAFLVGICRSILRRKNEPARFLISIYVIGVVAALALASAIGLNAFGSIRYALFLHLPLLVVAAFGLVGIAEMLSGLLKRWFKESRARVIGIFALAVVITLLASASTLSWLSTVAERNAFSTEFERAMRFIRDDDAPIVIYDLFAEVNLKALGVEGFGDRETFLVGLLFLALDEPGGLYEEYLSLLDAQRGDILSVSYYTEGTPRLPDRMAEIEARYVKSDAIYVSAWRIVRWTRRSTG